MSKQKKPGLGRYMGFIKGYGLSTLLTPVFIILEVLMEVFIPLLMAAIVDGGLYGKEDFMLKNFFSPELIANKTQFILTLGCLMILSALLSLLFGVLAARTAAVSSSGFAANLRDAVFTKIQSFSFKNTDKFSTPSLVMRCTTDVTIMQNTFQQVIRTLVRSPIMMIFAAIMALRVNSELAVIFILALPILAVALYLLIKIGHPRFVQMMKKYDRMNSDIQENLLAVRVVKSFVREDYEMDKFDKSSLELQKKQIFAQKMFSFSNPINMGVMWTCTIILLLIGGNKVFNGALSTGELVSLMTYSTQVVSSLGMASFLIMMIASTRASYNRINEVLDETPDIDENAESTLKVTDGRIDFDDVCFGYKGDSDNMVLNHINLHIKSGETIGIVGGTGDGKSTLMQLIPRFYDCVSGSVKIGGHDVKEYSLYELRESVSMVLQNNTLFSGTIAENLRWGNENATQEEIEEACKISCAHDFITSFPDGYDTLLGQSGVNVSGGQKQRLCIARALLKKPKVLIFDDSTSAVDTATDEKIRTGLRNSMKGVTKLIIAQRIASVMNSDRIIVMHEGEISDFGTHDELMQRSEIYREVYYSQMREGE